MKHFLFDIYQFIVFKKRGFPTSPLKILKELQKSQYWTREKTQAFQLSKLQELVGIAKEHTTYYKNLAAPEFNSLDEFTQGFPVLTKSDIVENRQGLLNFEVDRKHKHTTSGTTGQPVTFEISCNGEAHRIARIMRFYSWWGIRPGDRNVLIWGFRRTAKYTLMQKISRWLRKRLELNVFDINETTIVETVQRIEQFKPDYIRGYTTGLSMLAELMEDKGLQFKNINLKVIIVTGEILHEEARQHMERVFGCKIANEYGSSDCGLYAQECPEGAMHINEEQVLVKTDHDNVAYVTELNNDGMPIINYINNDRLVVSDDFCSCGRTSRLIEKIEGRGSDLIVLPNGMKKNPAVFYYIVQELSDVGYDKSVRHYKVLRKNDHFLMQVVKDIKFEDQVLNYIQKRMKEELGEGALVETEVVSNIAREQSGKRRSFVKIG